MLHNKEYIRKLNSLARQRIPFLFIVDFLAQTPLVYRLDAIPESIRFSMPNFPDLKMHGNNQVLHFEKQPVDFDTYHQRFQKVKDHLIHGNSFLANLTQPSRLKTNLTLEEIYERSSAHYKLLMKDQLVIFSPETFIKTIGNRIETFPMKGTIDAAIPDAEAKILSDPKEVAEHYTIVDLMRNDLSQIATEVEVDQFRYIGRIKTHEKEILQVSSKISARLPDNHLENFGDWLFRLLPAGSISGAPKKKTVEILLENEGYDRGFYTGVFGVFDGQNIDTAVSIRYIEKIDKQLVFKSGGGITYRSKVEQEYDELIDKVYVPITGNHKN